VGEVEIDKELLAILTAKVEVASRTKQSLAEAPAVVSVITREDLKLSGALSVGEALAMVPGLYGMDDLVGQNLGVRGINGGQRAYSRPLKVMLNGQPIAFRSDGANYTGPELIPIEAVERIEVVRGPASSLYGANAFLGVVNVITREASSAQGVGVTLRLTRAQEGLGNGAEVVLGESREHCGITAAFSGHQLERSGLRLPASSPMSDYAPLPETQSKNDLSKPTSGFFSTWLKPSEDLRLELTGLFNHLESSGEWLDFATLSHENVISLNQSFLGLRAQWQASRNLAFEARLTHAEGQPSSKEHLSAGVGQSFYPVREISYKAMDASLDMKLALRQRDLFILGVDQSNDMEGLINVYSVDLATGHRTLANLSGVEQGQKDFRNTGYYVEYFFGLTESWSVIANACHDHQNIYGTNTNERLGVVWTSSERVSAKLLFGTSYRAPSALYLYAQPLYTGELLGNSNLKPEKASTLEGEFRWAPSASTFFSVNLYRNRIFDKLELVPYDISQRASNLGRQVSSGAEGEGHLFLGALSFHAQVAYQRSINYGETPLVGEHSAPTDLYPNVTAFLRAQWKTDAAGTFELNAYHASERRCSVANVDYNFEQPYALSAYTLVGLRWLYEHGRHRVHLKVNNLLGTTYAESGFNGFDVPGRGRETQLSYSVRF
jgi:iron complex outermembrane receptor protein